VTEPLVLVERDDRGRRLSAREALAAGLIARVVAPEALLEEAKRVARDIAAKGPVATRLAKESVDHAFEVPLAPASRRSAAHLPSLWPPRTRRKG
jgi:enoyl-CoA hydratase/carnithine racemase